MLNLARKNAKHYFLALNLFNNQILNIHITNKIYNRPEYGVAAGAGIKLFIPGMGPLSIDYGYPLTNVGKGNKKGAFSFGVGDIF